MSSRAVTAAVKKQASSPPRRSRRRRFRLTTGMKVAVAIGAAVVVLGVIFFSYNLNNSGGQAGKYPFAVGRPGPGEMAPPIALSSTAGGTFNLAALHGKTVLLYFQEGLTCQPCWDQLKDIQAQKSAFTALGIDQIVSITTDPLNQLKQKVADQGITIPVLSDPSLAISQAYAANQYGMMGTSRDGHTFIVVGPDGRILWRADYGGPPNYTMYVPVSNLLADLRKGLHGAGA